MPGNLVSRDGFSRPVPRQPAHLHTQAESGAYLRDSSRVPRRPFIYLNRHTPSGQSQVYRDTQLRPNGVHCRESAGTGPVNPKVVPNLLDTYKSSLSHPQERTHTVGCQSCMRSVRISVALGIECVQTFHQKRRVKTWRNL